MDVAAERIRPVYDGTFVVRSFILMAHAIGAPSYRPYQPAFQWIKLLMFATAWVSQVVARIRGVRALTLVLVLFAVYVGGTRVDAAWPPVSPAGLRRDQSASA